MSESKTRVYLIDEANPLILENAVVNSGVIEGRVGESAIAVPLWRVHHYEPTEGSWGL